MKLPNSDFIDQLNQFVGFRGIDIILHMKDGRTLELDRNRSVDGDYILNSAGTTKEDINIPIEEIQKAEFYAT